MEGDLKAAAARGFLQGGNMASQVFKKGFEIKERNKQLEAKQQLSEMKDEIKSRWRCNRIPKTIVYVENIAEIEFVEQPLITWLIQAGCTRATVTNTDTAYHTELAEFEKQATLAESKNPDCDRLKNSHGL